ncbi:hypothetical protein ACLB2K_066894 [Fragaria x ananassa]
MARRSLATRYLVDTFMDDDDDIDVEYEELFLAQIEEKDLANKSSRRGYVMGHRIVNRDPIEGHEKLYHDYFANPPKYGYCLFRRRFRMKQALFMLIHDAIVAHDTYFVQSSRRGHRGSVLGHCIVNRDPIEGNKRLYHDYFANPPKYGARLFRRRFRMKQALFMRIHDVVVAHDTYFV